MKRIALVAALVASAIAVAAAINKTVNVLGATARVHKVCFERNDTGTVIQAHAMGMAFIADGGVGERGTAEWLLNAGARTTVNTFMDGPAVLQWRIDHGLEQ